MIMKLQSERLEKYWNLTPTSKRWQVSVLEAYRIIKMKLKYRTVLIYVEIQTQQSLVLVI